MPALLGLAAAAAVGVVLLQLAAVHTGEGRRLDDAAKGDLSAQSRAFDETSDLLDTISVASLAVLGAAIMAARAAARPAAPRASPRAWCCWARTSRPRS